MRKFISKFDFAVWQGKKILADAPFSGLQVPLITERMSVFKTGLDAYRFIRLFDL